VAVGVEVGVLVGVGDTGVAVGGGKVGVEEGVGVDVKIRSGCGVDPPRATDGVGVDAATEAGPSNVSLSRRAARTPATNARSGTSNQLFLTVRLSICSNQASL
jgi:hypothetical protein